MFLPSTMVTEVIRAVNHFTGNLDQPIKLKITATGTVEDVDSMTVIELMR